MAIDNCIQTELLEVLVSIDSVINGGFRSGQEVVATEISIEEAIEQTGLFRWLPARS